MSPFKKLLGGRVDVASALGFALVIVSCPPSALCQQVQLSMSSADVARGSSAAVALTLGDVGGAQPASLQWTMTYSGADITGAVATLASSVVGEGKTIGCNTTPGTIACALYGLNNNTLPSQTVATLTFTVSDLPSGNTIPVTLSGFASAADGTSIPVMASGASLSVVNSSGTGPSLSGLSCSPLIVTGPASTSCSVALTGSAGDSGFPINLSTDNSSVAVPPTITVAAGASSATFAANVTQVTASQSATLTAAAAGVTKTVSLNLSPSTGSTPDSIWESSTLPAIINYVDPNGVELGMKFRSDVAGSITAVRFYKGPYNRGTHLGHLWTTSGSLLGTVDFQNETAFGWQQANFAKPIPIQPDTTYVVSYYAPVGGYSVNTHFFTSALDAAPLHALQSGADGPNGVYRYGASGFPSQSYNANNYWVDLVFVPAGGTD